METVFETGRSATDESYEAGREAALGAHDGFGSDRVDFCQVFCSTEYDYDAVIAGIREVVGADAELIGCSATGAFTEGAGLDANVVVSLVASDTHRFFTGVGTGLSDNVSRAVREAVDDLPTAVDGYPYLSAITLHDGLRGVGERLALTTQQRLGPNVSFVGGAASDDFRLANTHVFVNDDVVDDGVAVALVASKKRPVITVDHGHEPITGPYEVTRADGSVVYELDGRPAFDVWEDAVRERARELFDVDVDELSPSDPKSAMMRGAFEFGIDQGTNYKMRWPMAVDGDALVFAVDIPEGTTLRVMYGSPENQVESARTAARQAVETAGDTAIAGGFVYDCACRAIILDDAFSDAVAAVDEELGVPFTGFETYGEMCMQLGQLSGFHNTTTVIMLLPR